MGIYRRRVATFAAALPFVVLSPALALAHTGVGVTHGFVHGFTHPIMGLDHVMAMVTVGIFAWQMGGRALWAVPAAFLGVMALGGAIGAMGIDIPLVELGIALSVVVLGAAVALDIRAPLVLATALVGFFALFHGHAHGAEIPKNAGGLAYGAGFMLATAALLLGGLCTGLVLDRAAEVRGRVWTRALGAVACLIGVGLVAGTM
ncbi:HupE/UreJ family protein [Ancylobacter lacus]|uniref:HupE/UreJ family protein n=1 Tax=Ancylobacter lacus TaxID=2579970 RepID=UPI001BCC504E|nr:HupE/UreJ family protein [Ancylobacter lacus]MBS7537517.1 HupE/UreJ family protein [Ancylobacter lacus]